MTLDIIQDNYINNHKYSFVWKWFIITFGIIYTLLVFKIIELPELYETIFNLSLGIVLIASLLNSFLFTRIGKLELIENILISRIDNEVETIKLNTIKTVKISSTNKNHYFLKFEPDFEVLVEMKNGQLDAIKQVLIKNKIEIIDTNFMSKLKNWFSKTKR
ncbi:hypothetical protein [Winogradskyella sp. R77965]|uniref:hypothetical protein n=1 Tax=Winogradskyella sp. R77965 TaxID=3093872 RepID=UPI0037DD9ACE